MNFYVSGPVVKELSDKDRMASLYLLIQGLMQKHKVTFPVRSAEMDNLAPTDFYRRVAKMISESDGVISIITDRDQSGPVESTIASREHKPQCIMEISSSAPRLLRGLPNVIDVRKIEGLDGLAQVRSCLEMLLKSLGSSLSG